MSVPGYGGGFSDGPPANSGFSDGPPANYGVPGQSAMPQPGVMQQHGTQWGQAHQAPQSGRPAALQAIQQINAQHAAQQQQQQQHQQQGGMFAGAMNQYPQEVQTQGQKRGASGCWYAARGQCANGAACPFSHRSEDLREEAAVAAAQAAAAQAAKPPCWYFERGVCTNAAACPFKHVGDIPQNAKRLKDVMKDQEEEDNIYIAVKVAFTVAAAVESEDKLKALRWKIAKYVKDSKAEAASASGPAGAGNMEKVINDYADYMFQKIYTSLGDRPWLTEVDFLLLLDAAVKDLFPTAVQEYSLSDLESLIFRAHDRALDEQKCQPIVWEIVQQVVQGPKSRKKVREACENGRQKAAANPDNLAVDDFARDWITCTIGILRNLTQGYPDSVLMKADAVHLFVGLLNGGALPERCSTDGCAAAANWHAFVERVMTEAYKAPAPTMMASPQVMPMAQVLQQWGAMAA